MNTEDLADVAPVVESAKGWLDKITAVNDYLAGAPLGVLLIIFALAGALGLRKWNVFPNNWIPKIVMPFTTIIFAVAAPRGDLEFRIWVVRSVMIGFILGIIALFGASMLAKKFPATFDCDPEPLKPEQTKTS